MQDSAKMKIILSSFFVLFILGFVGMYLFLNRKERGNVLGLSSDGKSVRDVESSGIPYILSAAPMVAKEGELYEYVPRVVDLDTALEDLRLELIEAPDWLFLSNGVVRGVVPKGDTLEPYSFTLRVSDGYNSSSQKSYILVESADE